MKNNKMTVIYARFSAEDNEDNGGARSIENQIQILSKYINDHNLTLVKIYTDVGKTGTNMNRPGLQELFEDMYKGLFNTIIVKDLSRFSRNYIEAGNYIENIFPALNIRFISVSDNYDSAINSEDESIILKNFLNAMYSKDIKRKIRKSIKRRYNTTDFVFMTKYGFKRDENGKLVKDEIAAKVIERIFNEAILGKKPTEIARGLAKDKIYNPSAHKKYVLNIKPNREPNEERLYKWDQSVIKRILTDYEYCGHAVNLTSSKPSKVVEARNVIVKNVRPVIIDEDIFNKAPKVFKEKTKKQTRYLHSLIYCKACGKLMIYHETKRKNIATYYCTQCHKKIDGDMVREVLYKDAVNVLKQSIYSPQEFLSKFIEDYNYKNSKIELENKLKVIEKDIQLLFENSSKGLITYQEYLIKVTELNKEYGKIEAQIANSPQPLDIKLLQYNYYEFVKNIEQDISNNDTLIYKVIGKAFVDLRMETPIIDIIYKFE